MSRGLGDVYKRQVSIYYGADETEEHAQEIGKMIEEKYPDVEVEINCGGQPIYYFVISVE